MQTSGLVIRNVRIVSPGRMPCDGALRIVGERLVAVGPDVAPQAGDGVFDAHGLTALPGFVDIHFHGRSGADFCDATDAAFARIGADKLKDGVTSFLATTLTRPEAELAEVCAAAERYKARSPDATCLGLHLEGPFFNPEMAGAQNPAYLREPDADFVLRLHAVSPVKKVSLAPELPGAEACIRALVARGIVASGGHSTADFACYGRARAAGMTHLTHLCNAMMPMHHLRPSMVTGALLDPDAYVEIICDGVHLSDPMIALIARLKGPRRVMLITDAMCAAGCPDGLYMLGGLPVRVADGCARLANVPTDPAKTVSNVAGSVALFPACLQRLARVTGWPIEEVVCAAGYNQLRSLGITDRGELLPGQLADVVLVAPDLAPQAVVCRGRLQSY